MNTKFKQKLNKYKKSVIGGLLSLVMLFSFNSTPMFILSNNIRKSNAYKSSNTQTYYPSTTTNSESNISSKYPEFLNKYFKGSNNNFDLYKYYTERFDALFSKQFEKYIELKVGNEDPNHLNYYKDYVAFLKSKLNRENDLTLLEYYKFDSTFIKTKYDVESYKGFVEYFVSHEMGFDNNKKLSPLFPQETEGVANSMWRSEFYNSFQNYVNGTMVSIKDGDGLNKENADFYKDSISYNLLKSNLDKEIEKTIAIYTYDKKQNRKIASIIANGAPIDSAYYYKDDSYETSGMPNIPIKKSRYSEEVHENVYYFGKENEISNLYPTDFKKWLNINEKEIFEKEPLMYRPIKNGEFGYIDSAHPTYYKYDSTSPYMTTNNIVDVYVLNNNPSKNDIATYNSLYFKVINQDTLNEDLGLDSEGRQIGAKKGFYFQVPYDENLPTYFEKISGYEKGSLYFTNFVNVFTSSSTGKTQSTIYLKYRADSRKTVYFDESQSSKTLEQFRNDYPEYEYKIIPFDYSSIENTIEANDYFLVDASFSTYFKTGYKLYFKKEKTYYKTWETSDVAYKSSYESKNKIETLFEQIKVASDDCVKTIDGKFEIFVLSNAPVELNEITYQNVTEEELNKIRNQYFEVSKFVSNKLNGSENKYKFYYRHKLKEVNKIYIVDDSKDAKNNEVYKNLNYTVLTSTEYKKDFSKYSIIQQFDENFNKNYKLYYKYDASVENKNLFVQNMIVTDDKGNGNAIYIVDDSLTSSDKTAYKLNHYIPISTKEFDLNAKFFTQINEDDKNYSNIYTKLYYKYTGLDDVQNTVYLYSSKSSPNYPTFFHTDVDYVADDYVLVEPTITDSLGNVIDNPDYVEGLELYYKKVRKDEYKTPTVSKPKNTYYSYSSNSTVSLKPASYYLVSFYAYTNGENVEASFYLDDTSKSIKPIEIEKIITNGKWVKYCFYVATDTLLSSAVNISFYMGNKDSILGSKSNDLSIKTITGTVLFDNIQITKVNETDYKKLSLNDKNIYTTPLKEGEVDSTTKFADEFNNQIIIANKEAPYNDANTYDNTAKNGVDTWNNNWDSNFNLDQLTNIFGDGTTENKGEIKTNKLGLNIDPNDIFKPHENIWQYYLYKGLYGQGFNDQLKEYLEAYNNNKLDFAIIDESTIENDKKEMYDKKAKEDADKDTDKDTDKDKDKNESDKDKNDKDKDDVKYVKSTFIENNKILKLSNSDRLLTLGLTSNTITIQQSQFYKLTIWVYATDEDSKARITLNSVANTYSNSTKLLSVDANVNACITKYSANLENNEYGWIPVSFFIEGNALHDQDITLALSAQKNSTVYFDNISIEKITSATYDTAKSDSNEHTYTFSLTPDNSVISTGISNGAFNFVNITDVEDGNDYTLPKAAKNWTVESNNSNSVIAGIVPTNNLYTTKTKNFYTEYNNSIVPTMPNSIFNNIYAVYAPKEIDYSIPNISVNSKDKKFNTTNIYKFYTSSISLSANSVYKISFDFYSGYNFNGNMISNLYYGSVEPGKLISTITDNTFVASQWNTYSFYVSTGTSATTIYLELGIENAYGTCFFKDVSSKTMTDSLDSIRDDLLSTEENKENNSNDLLNKESFKDVRFINLKNVKFSITNNSKNENSNIYENKEYKSELQNTKEFTSGKFGSAVASYYTSTSEFSYTVEINKIEYYIGESKDSQNNKIYKLYSDSTRKTEVTKIDGKKVSIPSTSKVVVGNGDDITEYNTVETEKINYDYKFNNDVMLNNNVITAEELNNTHSQNILILSNGMTTDYTIASPVYSTSLKTKAFYTLKIYVKTSDFDKEDFGLNINIKTITTSWNNINTTKIEKSEDNTDGFVCYQVLLTTNESSITNLSVEFSLGNDNNTGKGYAIIAGVELEEFKTEKLFNEYSSELKDDDKTVKKFYGNKSPEEKDDKKDEDAGNWTATFFYIFSSLLLSVVLIVALVAVFLKKHNIKLPSKDDSSENNSSKVKKVTKNNVIDLKEDEVNSTIEKHEDKDGFV